MTTLLDVSVLIALLDGDHVHHTQATRFFQNLGPEGWATCPLTENGVLRILGMSLARSGIGSPDLVRTQFLAYLDSPGHQFWHDDVSLMNRRLFIPLPGSKQLTDSCLLGLAVKHGGRLATFDASIDASLIPGGAAAYEVIKVVG